MNVQLDFKDNYLRVEVSGEQQSGTFVDDVRARWKPLFDNCRARDIYNILVVTNIKGGANISEMYDLMSDPSKIGWDPQFRMALVEKRAEMVNFRKFGENVGFNRGVHGNMFNNEEDALNWLLS